MSTAALDHTSAAADNSQSAKPEIVYGASAISQVICEDERRTYYLLAQGLVPGQFKIGNRYGLSVPAFRRVIHGDAA
jgi:hypothetical protein